MTMKTEARDLFTRALFLAPEACEAFLQEACGDNAERLTSLLKRIREARYGDEVDIRTRPTFFTIGLGKPFRSTRSVLEKLDDRNPEVKPRQLCGI